MDEQAEQDAVKKSAQLLQGISEAIHDERCCQPACSMRLSLRLRSINSLHPPNSRWQRPVARAWKYARVVLIIGSGLNRLNHHQFESSIGAVCIS